MQRHCVETQSNTVWVRANWEALWPLHASQDCNTPWLINLLFSVRLWLKFASEKWTADAHEVHILHLVHGKNAIPLVRWYENIKKLMPEKQKMFSCKNPHGHQSAWSKVIKAFIKGRLSLDLFLTQAEEQAGRQAGSTATLPWCSHSTYFLIMCPNRMSMQGKPRRMWGFWAPEPSMGQAGSGGWFDCCGGVRIGGAWGGSALNLLRNSRLAQSWLAPSCCCLELSLVISFIPLHTSLL